MLFQVDYPLIMIALNLLPLFVSKRRSSTGSFQIFFINDDTLLSPPSDTIETEKEGFTVTHLVESVMYVGKEPWHGLGKRLTVHEAVVASGFDLRYLFTKENRQGRSRTIRKDSLLPSRGEG